MKSKDLQPSKTHKIYKSQITQKIRRSSITAYSKYKAALENEKKKKEIGLRDKQGKFEVIDRD